MKYVLKDKWLWIDADSIFYRTVQEFMDALIPSKKMQHLCITNGWITLDDVKVKRETKIDGRTLKLFLYPNTNDYPKAEKDDIEVIYEDEIILIVNKPVNLLVHSDDDQLTLNAMVRSHYRNRNYYDLNPIHRLDRETSGLILYSKSAVFQPLLDQYLEQRNIRRIYYAFVKGKMEKGEKLSIDEPIGKDRHNAKKMIVYKKGMEAHTRVESLGYKGNISTLRCSILTGRTHQIRVHLSHAGYPIINDPLYGVDYPAVHRMGLVAKELSFYHPLLEENRKVSIEVDGELAGLMLK